MGSLTEHADGQEGQGGEQGETRKRVGHRDYTVCGDLAGQDNRNRGDFIAAGGAGRRGSRAATGLISGCFAAAAIGL